MLMPPPSRDPAARFSAVAMIRMTPVQKTKLDLLGAAHPGGTSALVRAWLDAHPLPGAAAPAPPTARAPRVDASTPSIPETAARFIELDPNP